MKIIFKIAIILLPIVLMAQTFTSYYTMIEKGKYEYVRKTLPDLRAKYPRDPEILFISGLVEPDGEIAINIFTDFYRKYPKHDKADNAFIKLIEYDYTRGLYNKSISNCATFLKDYGASEHIENCINVLINSYHAVGKNDSAAFYYNKYKKLIPHLNLAYNNSQYKPKVEILEKNSLSDNYHSYKIKSPVEMRMPEELKISLQFGAFVSPANAAYLKNKLKSKGYNAYTKKIEGQNGQLVAVRVGYFENRNIAESVGREIKKKEKLDFMIIKANR